MAFRAKGNLSVRPFRRSSMRKSECSYYTTARGKRNVEKRGGGRGGGKKKRGVVWGC